MKKILQRHLVEWLEEFRWDYSITLNPNEVTPYHQHINSAFVAKQDWVIERWCNFSDRIILGKRWDKNPNKTAFAAFPHIGPKSGLLHWHLVVAAPPSHKDPANAYRLAWSKVCRNGDAEIYPIGSGGISYSAKKVRTDFAMENYFFSTNFHPDRA